MGISLLDYEYHLKIKGRKVLDPIRKKWITLNPEELVRQLCVCHMMMHYGLSKNYIKVEKGLTLNQLQKRYDFIIYDKNYHPLLLVECKSYKVTLDQKVADQAARYNLELKAPYIWITNGSKNYYFHIDHNGQTSKQIDNLDVVFGGTHT